MHFPMYAVALVILAPVLWLGVDRHRPATSGTPLLVRVPAHKEASCTYENSGLILGNRAFCGAVPCIIVGDSSLGGGTSPTGSPPCDLLSCGVEGFRIDMTWSGGCGATCCPADDPACAHAEINGTPVFGAVIYDLGPPQDTGHFNTGDDDLPCKKARVDTILIRCGGGHALWTGTITHQCTCDQ
jgi:hypothetical protein